MTSRATAIKDWVVNAGVALIVIVALAGVGYGVSEAHTNAVLTQELITTGDRHHAETDTQNAQIIALQRANKALLAEHTTTFTQIIDSQAAICVALHITCSAPTP